jgi:gamma-tubulin complex component 4
MQQDRADTAEQRRDSRQQRMPMWRVRQHMTYLITNLQFYIQVLFLPK